MSDGLHVNKYRFTAKFSDAVVSWALSVETEGGQKFQIPLRDGEEVPVLLSIFKGDAHVYFDPKESRLSTGWNVPGA